jgi:cob(I)alamin adenosyltransferase
MKIYTRGGDGGETSLLGGGRVRKSDPRIDAYGTVDELNAVVGLVRASWPQSALDEEMGRIQSDLFDLGARLASPGLEERFPGPSPARVTALEAAVDAMEEKLPPLTSFILPGGALASSFLHLARTVCRRAERLVVGLESGNSLPVVVYLNRLSDYLFVAARFVNQESGVADVPWHPGEGPSR